jgi:hypothetical protein
MTTIYAGGDACSPSLCIRLDPDCFGSIPHTELMPARLPADLAAAAEPEHAAAWKRLGLERSLGSLGIALRRQFH